MREISMQLLEKTRPHTLKAASTAAIHEDCRETSIAFSSTDLALCTVFHELQHTSGWWFLVLRADVKRPSFSLRADLAISQGRSPTNILTMEEDGWWQRAGDWTRRAAETGQTGWGGSNEDGGRVGLGGMRLEKGGKEVSQGRSGLHSQASAGIS